MEQIFFRVPFASNGDTASIPVTVTTDGSVNWPQGWPLDYEKDMDADANAKPVEREVMNFMFNAVTVALRQYQSAAFPEFITAADSNGNPFSYSAGTVIRYRESTEASFKNYVSLADGNTSIPGSANSKWQEFIFAESTEEETLDGESGTSIITPRRLKVVRDIIDDKLDDLEDSVNRVNNLQVANIVINGVGSTAFTVPVDCKAILILGYAWMEHVNSNNGWNAYVYFDNVLAASRSYYGSIGGSKGHSHKRLTELNFTNLVDVQYSAGQEVELKYATSGLANGRGLNLALQFIQADTQQGEDEPTNIIISPNGSAIDAGAELQFAATVLPQELAEDFPVTWAVTDDSLGEIDQQGLYIAREGVTGIQTVIAAVSSGLNATATVSQFVFLESIAFGNVPDLIVGDTYPVSTTFSPVNFTEPVTYSSSDSATADISNDGSTITANGSGAATLTATGLYSGVSASVTVRVSNAEEVIPYLQIENNLSEIADAWEEAQAESREHLGLGKLATKDSLSADDVGAAPMAVESLAQDLDLDELTAPGDYFQSVSSYATAENHYPEETADAIRVVATGVSEGACRQFYWPYNSTKEYRHYSYGDPIKFGEWEEH